uniref:Uncharacterized protein n=1 Tax=Arundo donax TaxID=35708 RepID=A0A0A8YWZ6_ARUDO
MPAARPARAPQPEEGGDAMWPMTRSSTLRRWDSARMVCALASQPSMAGLMRTVLLSPAPPLTTTGELLPPPEPDRDGPMLRIWGGGTADPHLSSPPDP